MDNKTVVMCRPCPHCGESIQIERGSVTLCVPQKLGEDGNTLGWRESLDDETKECVELAESSGLLEPFQVVWSIACDGQELRNPARAFIAWSRTAKGALIPQFAMSHFSHILGEGRVGYIRAQRIGAVLLDGRIALFVPDSCVLGKTDRDGKVRVRLTNADLKGLMDWTRTRNGYVVGKGCMYQQLQRKSYGEFARPMIEHAKGY